MAESNAILIQDRNTQKSVSARTTWSSYSGSFHDWMGMVIWKASDHAEFLTSYQNLTTKYLTTVNTADSLFSQGQSAGDNTDSAMFNYTSANY
jgi:hypothetical protein